MIKFLRTEKKTFLRHLLSWLLITIYVNVIDPFEGDIKTKIICGAITIINYIIIYYSLSLVIFPTFWAKNYFYFVLAILVAFAAFILVQYLNLHYIHFFLYDASSYRKSIP